MYIGGHMGKTQTVRLIGAVAVLILMVVPVPSALAVIRTWESFTSFDQVTDMALYNGDVWVAATGGLVRIDPLSMSHTTYTNVDGLDVTRINCLCVDSRHRLWVGSSGRLVNFTDPGHTDGYLFTDRDGAPVDIYDIACSPDGDSLWLANRLGLTLFLASDDPGQGLILDTYSRYGEIERDTPARCVALTSDSIWVGTDGGLAIGSRHDVRLLKAPLGWISYFPSRFSPLGNDMIKGIVVKQDTVFIGTSSGAYRLDRGTDTTLVTLGVYGDPLIYNMSAVGDSVLINTARGFGFYYNGLFAEEPVPEMPIPNTSAGVVDDDGRLWLGNLLYGIYFREASTLVRYDAGGTPYNECQDIVAAQGKIWGAFGNEVLAYFDNDRWTRVPGIVGRLTALEVGPLGEVWVGTEGNGVYRVLGDSLAHFTAQNSELSGPWNAPNFVVVKDIHSSGDAVWFAVYYGAGGELAVVNPYNTDPDQWRAFTFVGGDNAELMVTVTTGQDVVYAGSEENGIYAIAYGGTPFYTGDDIRFRFTTSNSGIGSDFIRALEIDAYDTLWVGTSYGLSYQTLGEIYFNNMGLPQDFGPEVTTLAFDAQGSFYAGSGRGVLVRDIGTGSFELITSLNSGLVDDDIHRLYYDSGTDALWMATGGGISRMTAPYALAARDVAKVLAYPNPFIIRQGNETVRFNFAGQAEVRIFTLAGELVREMPVVGVWDGRNADGREVASGVYIFVLTTPEGEFGRGKIFLVRE